jgi:hypothetical protein
MTLHGDLGTVLEWTARNKKSGAPAVLSASVVAGEGFEPPTLGL